MKRMFVAVGVLGILCVAVSVQAEEAKPGAELKKLDMFVGEWTFEESGKDSETGEEWTSKGTGQYSKLGEFFYVWRGENETVSFLAIDAYDPVTKGMVRHAFGSAGWQGTGTWAFGDETITVDMTGVTASGKETRSRCTGNYELPTNTVTCDDLIDGNWVAASKTTQTKVK